MTIHTLVTIYQKCGMDVIDQSQMAAQVWDPLDGSLVRVLQQARRGVATSSPVYGLSFAANGLHIISCGTSF